MPLHRTHLVLASALLACGPGRGDTTDSAGEGDTSGTGGEEQPLLCVDRHKLDVLIVLEDSPGMADSQWTSTVLAQALTNLLDEYGDYDYRIAFTGTSVGGTQCAGASVGDGAFRDTSCRARLADFVSPDPGVDPAESCLQACPHEALTFLPTAIDGAAGSAPRPWIESITGVTNLGGGVTAHEAAACLAPQGTAGCTFAAPLEAMARALGRALDPADRAHGFLRPDAELVVAFVSDSHDCSVRPESASIFDPAGDRAFWSDPTTPTPGICWNAGVRCTGGPDTFSACDPENYGQDGTPGVGDADAVLLPVAHYQQLLQGLITSGRTAGVSLTALTGVPTTSSEGTPIPYSLTCPADQLAASAICPGCAAMGRDAAPPVRLRALAEAFPPAPGEPSLASLCGDPSFLWLPLGRLLDGQLKPLCVERCLADVDITTPVLDPDCTVTETRPGEAPVELPACVEDLGYLEPPAGWAACFAVLVDADGQTPSPLDDLSIECHESGRNGEIRLIRSAPAPDGTCLSVRCASSPAATCP